MQRWATVGPVGRLCGSGWPSGWRAGGVSARASRRRSRQRERRGEKREERRSREGRDLLVPHVALDVFHNVVVLAHAHHRDFVLQRSNVRLLAPVHAHPSAPSTPPHHARHRAPVASESSAATAPARNPTDQSESDAGLGAGLRGQGGGCTCLPISSFLMATERDVVLHTAENTSPDDPCPI